MNGITRIGLLKLGAAILLLCVGSGAVAAGTGQPRNEIVPELDEILVYGTERTRHIEDILPWLQRLIGEHSYSGFVELGGEGAPRGRRTAGGVGKCVPFGRGAVVQCAIRVLWRDITAADGSELPGGISRLSPALMLFGVDTNRLGIASQLVDNLGMSNGGLGYLYGDTLITTTDCVDLPGNCQRISRVTAQSDGKEIRIEIEIQRDADRVAHYVFELRRIGDARASEEEEQ